MYGSGVFRGLGVTLKQFVGTYLDDIKKIPSRYAGGKETIDQTVGRIIGRFTTHGRSPLTYLYTSFDHDQLIGYYRAADIALVTPLRDGMNLVAKEFVASRTDGDGVLVLSEFAGAAAELSEALVVNPYDVERTAEAFHRALVMPAEERRTRMAVLRERVRTYDVHRWARSFVDRLEWQCLRVGSSEVDLTFSQRDGQLSVEVTRRSGEVEVIVER